MTPDPATSDDDAPLTPALTFLSAYLSPAFGARSKLEIDVLAFRWLCATTDALAQGSPDYVATQLRIARTRAVNLRERATIWDIPIPTQLRAEEADQAAGDKFIAAYCQPAFGAKAKTETDILVLEWLVETGRVRHDDSAYETAIFLGVTPGRVRSLLLNLSLRTWRSNSSAADDALAAALLGTTFFVEDKRVSFCINDPAVQLDLKRRLRSMGTFSDGSFSPDIVRMGVTSFVSVLDGLLSESAKKVVVTELAEGGAEIDTFTVQTVSNCLSTLLISLGGKYLLGDTGAAAVSRLLKALTSARSPKRQANEIKVAYAEAEKTVRHATSGSSERTSEPRPPLQPTLA